MLLAEILTGARPDRCPAVLEGLLGYHHSRHRAIAVIVDAAQIDPTSAAALYEIVVAAASGDHLTATDLARVLGLTRAAVSDVVDRLVRAGLVHRSPHPTDRRKVLLRPDPAAAPELLAAKRSVLSAAAALTPAQERTVAGFFAAMSSVLESGADGRTSPAT